LTKTDFWFKLWGIEGLIEAFKKVVFMDCGFLVAIFELIINL